MAKAGRKPASGGTAVFLAILIALPALASPFVIRMFLGADQQIVEESAPLVERARRTLMRIDEDLSFTSELRKQLGHSGATVSAEGAAAGLEARPEALKEIEDDLRKGDTLRTDKLTESMERIYADVFKKSEPLPRGLSAQQKSPAQSFKELESQIAANQALLKTADADVKEALSKLNASESKVGQDTWANRLAAMVAWQRGRTFADRAWLDRWRAAELRLTAEHDLHEQSRLMQVAKATEAGISTDLITATTAASEDTAARLAEWRKTAEDLRRDVDAKLARIAELRGKAMTARRQLAQMDLSPFKPGNRHRAGSEFNTYRIQYEALSDEARRAESEADAIEHGALADAKRVDDVTDELINAAYEGGKPARGVVELQDELDASMAAAASYEMASKEQAELLSTLQSQSQELKEKAQSASAAAEALGKSAGEKITAIAGLMKSAREHETAARAAFKEGEKAALAAQAAAKARVQEASKTQQEAGEEKSERLSVVIADKHTEIGALVLAAMLDWSAAESYAAALDDVAAQARLESMRGKISGTSAAMEEQSEPDDDQKPDADAAKEGKDAKPADPTGADEWRKAAATLLELANKHLGAADTLIKTANYELVEGRVNGAALRWQVLQLQAAVDLMGAFVAADAQGVEDAKARARAKLEEALKDHASSPLLQDAAATLSLLQ